MEYLVYYIVSGILVGTLAGLFGVGGGIIIVPILTVILRSLGFSDEILFHTAIGTSLATILFTSLSSLFTHNSNKAVLWKVVAILTPGILIGAGLGSIFASSLRSQELKYIFIFFVILFSVRMLFPKKLTSLSSSKVNEDIEIEKDMLPHWSVQSLIGFAIGFSSALVGIGGGVFTSSYLILYRKPIHLAIGTSAAVGFPIAISGTISYIYSGYANPYLQEGSLGFIFLPALVGIVVGSMPFAYLGAKLSHRLDRDRLRKYFAIFLLCMASYMLFK